MYWGQLQMQISLIMWLLLKGAFEIIIRCFCFISEENTRKYYGIFRCINIFFNLLLFFLTRNEPNWLSYWSSNAGLGCCGTYKWPYHSMCSRPASQNWQRSRVWIQHHWQYIINETKNPLRLTKQNLNQMIIVIIFSRFWLLSS